MIDSLNCPIGRGGPLFHSFPQDKHCFGGGLGVSALLRTPRWGLEGAGERTCFGCFPPSSPHHSDPRPWTVCCPWGQGLLLPLLPPSDPAFPSLWGQLPSLEPKREGGRRASSASGPAVSSGLALEQPWPCFTCFSPGLGAGGKGCAGCVPAAPTPPPCMAGRPPRSCLSGRWATRKSRRVPGTVLRAFRVFLWTSCERQVLFLSPGTEIFWVTCWRLQPWSLLLTALALPHPGLWAFA